jgi:hypothetical protein
MQDDQINSDVELVVHKEKLRKAKPKSGLATSQPEEHDAWSVSVDIVSAVGTPAYHPGFPLCIQFMIPGDRREST